MRAFVLCNAVTISATDENGFAGFLLRTENYVGTFSVSSDDTRTACSVKYACAFSSIFRIKSAYLRLCYVMPVVLKLG